MKASHFRVLFRWRWAARRNEPNSPPSRPYSLSGSPTLKIAYPIQLVSGHRHLRRKEQRVGKLMSKSELIEKLAEMSAENVSKRDVKAVMEALAALGHKELKRTGAFLVPGLVKFVVIKKAATKARKGINPFTKEPTIFKAKPARKIIKARPVKAAKDALL